MGFSLQEGRIAAGAALAFALLASAGCQSGGGATAALLGTQSGEGGEVVQEAELRAFCPPVRLREGTASFNTYQRGGDDDPSRIIYQASIADVTRACSYAPGTMTINVAVAGRVVPGPAGRTGTINMPIRVAVVSGSEVLYSQLHRHPVTIGDTIGATQFVLNDPVTIPTPGTNRIAVFAGYDEGPYDTP